MAERRRSSLRWIMRGDARVGAVDLDEPAHLDHRLDVRALDRARLDPRVLERRGRSGVVGGREQVGALVARAVAGRLKRDELQLAPRAVRVRDRCRRRAMLDAGLLGPMNVIGPPVPSTGRPSLVTSWPLGVDLERAVAGVALALRRSGPRRRRRRSIATSSGLPVRSSAPARSRARCPRRCT